MPSRRRWVARWCGRSWGAMKSYTCNTALSADGDDSDRLFKARLEISAHSTWPSSMGG
ncbi:hypothetical protein D3C71_1852520 [compost metagenome]